MHGHMDVKFKKKEALLADNFIFGFNLMSRRQIYTEMTNFRVYIKFWHVPPSASLHFANRVRRSRAGRLSRSSCFFMQATAAAKMADSNSYRVSTFVWYTSLFIQPHKQKSNGNTQEFFLFP